MATQITAPIETQSSHSRPPSPVVLTLDVVPDLPAVVALDNKTPAAPPKTKEIAATNVNMLSDMFLYVIPLWVVIFILAFNLMICDSAQRCAQVGNYIGRGSSISLYPGV